MEGAAVATVACEGVIQAVRVATGLLEVLVHANILAGQPAPGPDVWVAVCADGAEGPVACGALAQLACSQWRGAGPTGEWGTIALPSAGQAVAVQHIDCTV